MRPLSAGNIKRLSAFVITQKDIADLPGMTKDIVERIKYAEVYESEKSELKLEGTPARVIWVYFGRDESDITNSLYFAYTIWVADDEMRARFFKDNKNTHVEDDICINENTSYDMLKKMQEPIKSREEYIEANKRVLALIVTKAERFIYDLQETANGTCTIEDMQSRYGEWIKRVNDDYIRLSDEDVPPDDLHDWSYEIMDLAGWVVDMSIWFENKRGGGIIGENEKWLMKSAIKRYKESLERLKKLEEDIEW